MTIRTPCPTCGAITKAPETAIGQRVKCPKCRSSFVVPSPDEALEIVEDEKPKHRPADDDEDRPRKKKKKSKKFPKWVLVAVAVVLGLLSAAPSIARTVRLWLALDRIEKRQAKNDFPDLRARPAGPNPVAPVAADRWEPFDAEHFAVEFPRKPVTNSSTVPGGKSAEPDMASWSARDRMGRVYDVTIINLDAGVYENYSTRESLSLYLSTVKLGAGQEPRVGRKVIDGQEWLEIASFSNHRNSHLLSRVAVGGRKLMVFCISDKTEVSADDADAKKWFESIRVKVPLEAIPNPIPEWPTRAKSAVPNPGIRRP